MILNVTDRERVCLLELLDAAHREKLHELHHTDSSDYQRFLRERIGIIEGLRDKTALEQATA